MFATLGGSLPRPALASERGPLDAAVGDIGERDLRLDEVVRDAIVVQEDAGLEPVTDGGLRHADRAGWLLGGMAGVRGMFAPHALAALDRLPSWRGPITVGEWRFAAACSSRAVKGSIVGPYTLAGAVEAGSHGREAVTLALAEALNEELRALAVAGCPLLQVDEDAATLIGDSPEERRLFREAQRRLLEGLGDAHASLAIRGGNADDAGAATILDAPYRSYLFD